MTEGAEKKLLAALAALSAALDDIDSPSMIIGGIAVIARGVARSTLDIDATVWAEGVRIEAIQKAMKAHGIVPRIARALDFARKNQVLLLVHGPTGTPVDISMAWLPFEREALARATREDLAGVSVRVATPEDLIVLKAVAWRDRDRSDVERLLVAYGSSVDLERVRRLAKEFADILGEPQRMDELESVISRALEPRERAARRRSSGKPGVRPPKKPRRGKGRKTRSPPKRSR